MDLAALLTYLRTLGDPLPLDAGDRNLPGPLRDFLTSVPGRGLIIGPGAGLRLDGTVLTMSGSSPGSWPVTKLGRAAVTTDSTEIRCGADGQVSGTVHGRLPLTASVLAPVTVASLPPEEAVGGGTARGWRLSLVSDAAGVTPADLLLLGRGAAGAVPFAEPAGLNALRRQLTVPASGFAVTFYPGTAYDALLTFEVAVPGLTWAPVPGVLSLDRIALAGTVTTAGFSTALTGRFTIGGVPMELTVGLTDGTVLRAAVRPVGSAAFPGLAALAAWAGGTGTSTGTDPGVSAIGGNPPAVDAAIRQVRVRFDTATGTLRDVEVISLLTLGALRLDVAFRYPQGTVAGGLHNGEAVALADVIGSFGLPTAGLPAAARITAADFSATPALGTYLADLAADTDLTAGPLTITNVFFGVERTPWDGFTGRIGGTVAFGSGVLVDLMGEYAGADTGWVFTGALATGRTMDLDRAAADLTAAGHTRPALPAGAKDHGIPEHVTLTEASFRLVPQTGALHMDGRAEGPWRIPFGATTLVVTSVGAVLDVPGQNLPTSGSVSGTLEYAGLRAVLTLALGGPAAQTVFTGTVAAADAPQISVARLTEGVCAPAAGTGWQSVAPAALAPAAFTSAAVYLNVSASRLMVYGRLGGAGLPSGDAFVYLAPDPRPGQAARMRYAVAVTAGPEFRFASLLPTLGPDVDDRLRVTEARLVVTDLAGTTLGDLARETTELLTDLEFPAAPLTNLGGASLALSRGVVCAARVDFGASALFGRIVEIGTDDTRPTVWLSALIDAAAETVFTAHLPDITIARFVRLTHTDAEPNGIRIDYRPARADRLDLVGRIELDDVFGRTYRFDVTLTADNAGLVTRIRRATAAQEIPEPFGLPGLRFFDLTVDLAVRWAAPAAPGRPAVARTSSLVVNGRVLLGPGPNRGEADHPLDCAARLVLRDGIPALFDVALARDWSLGAFAAQCFTGTAASWPGTLIDVKLRAGSRISYYDPVRDPGRTLRAPDGSAPGDGFTIDARLTLTLLTDLDLHTVVTVRKNDRTGRYDRLSASAVLAAPLDLGFMSLAGPTLAPGSTVYTGGPVLTLETGPAPKAVLQTGVNFLGQAFAAVGVSVAPAHDGGRIFTGRLTATRELAPFGALDCGFQYATHPGGRNTLTVDGWPSFVSAENLVDFVSVFKTLSDAESASLCGPLTKLVAHRPVSSTYTITPSARAVGGDLVFRLTVGCALTLVGASTPFLSMDFPAFDVHVPTSTRWADLPAALTTGVRHAAGDFARALLADPAKIALFLALVVGEDAAEVATILLCDGLVDSAAVTATEAAVAALAAAGGVLTAGALAAVTAAIAAALVGPVNQGGGRGPGTIGTPVLREAAYADGTVTARWHGASLAAGYVLTVQRPDGTELASRALGLTLSGTVAIDPEPLPPGEYWVRVRGVRGKARGDWSPAPTRPPAAANQPLTKAAVPAPTLVYGDHSLTAACPPPPGTDHLVIQVFDPAGGRLTRTTVPAAAPTVEIPLPQATKGAYTVVARALRTGHFPGAWSAAVPFTVLSLTTPTILSFTHTGAVFSAAWNAPAPCDVSIVDNTTGTVVATAAEVTGGRVTLTPASGIEPGRTYVLRVQADIPGVGQSDVALRALTAHGVGAPVHAQLRNDNGTVTASWSPVTATTAPAPPTYTYQLIDAADPTRPVGGGTGLVGTRTTVVLADGRRPGQRHTYRLRVRAEAAGTQGAWTTSPDLLMVTLPPPVTPRLAIDGTGIAVSWTDPAEVTADADRRRLTLTHSGGPLPPDAVPSLTYQVLLLSNGVQVGHAENITARRLVLTRDDGHSPKPGENYTARIRLTTPDTTGPWTGTPNAHVLGPVQGARASLSPTKSPLIVSWTPPSVPASGVFYEVAVTRDRDAQGSPVPAASGTTTMYTVQPTPAAPSPGSTKIPFAGWLGHYTVKIRARTTQTTGPWTDAGTVSLLPPAP